MRSSNTPRRLRHSPAAALLLGVLICSGTPAQAAPVAHAAATCSDYSNQADAQRAADTRDADGDGIYCESLPCPCLKPGGGSGEGGGGGAAPAPKPSPKPTVECGVERWPVKTLTDARAKRINFDPVDSTVSDLRELQPPDISKSAKRQSGEFTTYRLHVRLRSFKIEADSDIHLVVADAADASKTMIVELPNAGCTRTAGAKARRQMAAARAALLRSCGAPSRSSFALLTGTATITGVAFYDLLHGQRGVAPNGIELHPMLSFKARTRCGRR
jgi:hypothetical protein